MRSKKLTLCFLSFLLLSSVGCNTSTLMNDNKINISAKSTETIIDLAAKTGKKTNVRIPVTINLQNFKLKATSDGVPAKNINDIKSYKVSICSDPSQPISTRWGVATTPIVVNRDGSSLSSPHTITFTNVPPLGPIFATVEAFDGIGGTGNSLIKPNNGNVTPYANSDAGAKIAVSTNNANVYSDFTFSFTPPTPDSLQVTANLQDGSGASVDTQITPHDGGIGMFANSPELGLLAFYPFNSDANDISGNGNNGTVNGATLTNNRFSIPNKAYNFDGSTADIQVSDSASLRPSAVSVQVWMKSTTVGGYLVSKSLNGGWSSYAIYASSGNLAFHIGNSAFFNVSPFASANVWDGNWHHIVGTYDGTTIRLYEDGVEVGTGTPDNRILDYSTDPLTIGNYQPTASYHFNGDLDDVRIYDRALTPSEITALYTVTQ